MGLIAGPNVKGGTFLLEGSLEYRLRFLENIGTAIFFDYGNTWLGYKNFRFDEVAIATGFGLRYYTEVAPFRIDFGFKFYDPKNKKFLWENWNEHFLQNIEFHFGIGEAF
jgi:outer membrane protein assembly factor BamA